MIEVPRHSARSRGIHAASGFCDYASLRAEWRWALLLPSWSENRM